MSVPDLFVGLPPLDDDATDIHSLSMLLALLYNIKPVYIVEAGTYHGHFAVGAARLLPDSHVWTCDLVRPDLPDLPNLHFIHGDFERDLLPAVQPTDVIGFAYIDSGTHREAEGYEPRVRVRHWNAVLPRLSVGGIAAVHDANRTDWHGALDILAQCHFRTYGGAGLAFWQAR